MGDEMERGSGDRFDVAVIGAGQAGLAMGYFLAREGRHFTILEASDSIGSAWRTRWDSLVLFTPRRYDSLPGLPFPGDPDGYPGRDEVISYLERYASTFELPVELNSPVQSVAPADGGFILNLGTRTLEADQVVVATGPFQVPNVPAFAADLAPDVVQMHSTGYRRPSDVPEGTVVGRRRRQHRIPDSQGTVGDPLGSPCDRISADTAAAASARTRSLLVADEDGTHQEDGRVAHRASCTRSRHADRLEHARREASRR